MTPLYQTGAFGYPTAMALATVLGIGFGFALERAGFGRAGTLVAQFYGDDMRVLKVMFSAIVTTMVGLGILSGVGVIDLALITIPDTFILPAIVGGLLLGVGFVMSGYCPGTALVATGSGHVDGLVALVGIMLGSLVFGFAYDAVEPLYLATGMGRLTFVDVLGVPWQLLAIAVTAMAVAAFLGGEAVERILARRHEHAPPAGTKATRNRTFVALGVASLLGALTLALPAPTEPAAEPVVAVDFATIAPVELAEAVTSGLDTHYVVDLRSTEACTADRIRTALCLSADDPEATFIAGLPATRTLVLYGDADLETLPVSVLDFAGPVRVLDGGWAAFRAELIAPPQPPAAPTAEDIAAYEHRVALHSWLTGSQAVAAPVMARPVAAPQRAARQGGGC